MHGRKFIYPTLDGWAWFRRLDSPWDYSTCGLRLGEIMGMWHPFGEFTRDTGGKDCQSTSACGHPSTMAATNS